MKKLIGLISIIILLGSCAVPIEQVSSPEKETTVELLNVQKDSVEIYIKENIIYIYKDGLIIYNIENVSDSTNSYRAIHGIYLFFFVIVCFVMIVIIIDAIIKK